MHMSPNLTRYHSVPSASYTNIGPSLVISIEDFGQRETEIAVADGTDPQPAHAYLFWNSTVVDMEATRIVPKVKTLHLAR
jgi:hypothetical protein